MSSKKDNKTELSAEYKKQKKLKGDAVTHPKDKGVVVSHNGLKPITHGDASAASDPEATQKDVSKAVLRQDVGTEVAAKEFEKQTNAVAEGTLEGNISSTKSVVTGQTQDGEEAQSRKRSDSEEAGRQSVAKKAGKTVAEVTNDPKLVKTPKKAAAPRKAAPPKKVTVSRANTQPATTKKAAPKKSAIRNK